MLCAKNQVNCITLSEINLGWGGGAGWGQVFTSIRPLTYIKSPDRSKVKVKSKLLKTDNSKNSYLKSIFQAPFKQTFSIPIITSLTKNIIICLVQAL